MFFTFGGQPPRQVQVRGAVHVFQVFGLGPTTGLLAIALPYTGFFAKVFAGFNAQLPLITRGLLGFSSWMIAWWPVLLALAVAIVVLVRAYLQNPQGRYNWDRRKLNLPIVGPIILKSTLARFARSFALASRAGVPVIQALSTVALTVDNLFMARKIEGMRETVERGESVLKAATVSGVFTPVVLQMISVGEESGALDEMMQEIADMYQREVEYELKTLAQQIEPILILFLGAMVLVLAMGIFLPIWDLGKTAFKH